MSSPTHFLPIRKLSVREKQTLLTSLRHGLSLPEFVDLALARVVIRWLDMLSRDTHLVHESNKLLTLFLRAISRSRHGTAGNDVRNGLGVG